jgi:hypothetical protein
MARTLASERTNIAANGFRFVPSVTIHDFVSKAGSRGFLIRAPLIRRLESILRERRNIFWNGN